MSITYTRNNTGALDEEELILCSTTIALSNVKVRLVAASTYGEVDKASGFTPNADLNDLLNKDCIKIKKMKKLLGVWVDDGEWVSFRDNSNNISLIDSLAITEMLGFQIKFDQIGNWTSGRKLYIGVEVYGE